MAVNQRGDQAAVGIADDGGVVRLGGEVGDGFIAIPHRFDLVAVAIEMAATVAVGYVVWVVVLKCVQGLLRLC